MPRFLHETPIVHRLNPRIWRVTPEVNRRFLQLVGRLASEAHDSEESMSLRDQIRSLPGHPHNFDPERDVIIRIDTTTGEQL